MKVLLAALISLLAHLAAAEELKIAVLKSAASGPAFIALDRGYFAAEGFEAALVPFAAAQPVAFAVVTHNAAFGVAVLNAGFYSLAAQGELRLIAGAGRAMPTYKTLCYAASNAAYAGGLTAPGGLAGHSIALTQVGAPGQYALGLLAAKDRLDLKSMRIVPLSSFPNIVTALAGNRVDAGLLAAAPCLAAAAKGAAKILGWVDDETPFQMGGVFAAAITAEDRPDFVERFLRAYARGASDYYDAFSAPDGSRRDGPTAPETLALIAKHSGEPAAQMRETLAFVDRAARFDRADVMRQVAGYKAQGLLKADVDAAAIIDDRYVK